MSFSKKLLSWSIIIAAQAGLTACTNGQTLPLDYIRTDPVTITDKTDSALTYRVDRPDHSGRYPLLIMIDGSSCRGWQAIEFDHWMRPDNSAPRPFARVFVEKRGVAKESWGEEECSETFLKTFTIDKRVEDHLRVLQHLRANADWWNGELFIIGWSDGGDIAAQLTAYYPNVSRSVLGAMGGGTTMAEQFQDLFICPDDNFKTPADRAICLTDLNAAFDDMRDNPTWKETWSGYANSHRVWATRLDTRLTPLLADVTTPILIVQGQNDQNNAPVSSARALIDGLNAAGQTPHTYWEVPEMAHTPQSLGEKKAEALMRAMRDWLLIGDTVLMPE